MEIFPARLLNEVKLVLKVDLLQMQAPKGQWCSKRVPLLREIKSLVGQTFGPSHYYIIISFLTVIESFKSSSSEKLTWYFLAKCKEH